MRKKNDGLVFFRFKSHNEKGEIINDVIVENTEIEKDSDEKSQNLSLFVIYYRRDNENYYIKSLSQNEKYFSFINLIFGYQISNGIVVSVQNFSFKFNINDENTLIVTYEFQIGQIQTK